MNLPYPPTNPGGGCPLDLSHDTVRDHVAHILRTPGFARSERLKRFLCYTVERSLAGDAANLKEYSIALEVFDRSPDYNPKIDAVVRVEARRLRSRLEQYYANEGLRDSIRIRFPTGTYAPLIQRTEAPCAAGHRVLPAIRRSWWWLAGGLAVVAMATVALRLSLHPHATAGIVRLIRDSAAAFDPAVSGDGQMLAYASDQSGNVDIWVRPVDSGEARRLTSDQAVDASPDFSPDSTQIAFRSERNGGGVYLIPVAGGLERLVMPLGRSPKFSPNGNWIAYWTGQNHHFEGKTFIVPSNGGKAVRVGADLADAKWPVWSSDGGALLVYGTRLPASVGGSVPGGPLDLYLLPIHGGPAREIGWTAALRRANLWAQGPVSWDGALLQFSATTTPATDFSRVSQGVANLWQMHLTERRGRVEGEPYRLTFGSALEGDSVILRGGGTVYSSTNYTLTPLEILLDEHGLPRGGSRAVFSSAGSYIMPRVSRDGSTLVALSDRSGQVDIWQRNLRTGEERAVTSTSAFERNPLISSDGRTVFFGIREGPLYPAYKVNLSEGAPRKVCADCGSLADVSADGDSLLYHAGEPWSAYSLNLTTGNRTLILSHARRTFSSRISPDGKWVAFLTDTGADEIPRRIQVAPFTPNQATPESQWIPITDGEHWDFEASWSSDGAMLYFLSDRDGNRCIWAIRLDPQSKRGIGNPFAVLHLHTMGTHIPVDAMASAFGLSPSNGRLIFGAMELSSKIYRVESPK
jgi:eukaryotic-like serine/threonine-protein kinase